METKKLPYTKSIKFSENQRKILEKKYKKVKDTKLSDICDNLSNSVGIGVFYYKGTLKEKYKNIDHIELALIAFECTRMNGGTVKIDRNTGEFEIID